MLTSTTSPQTATPTTAVTLTGDPVILSAARALVAAFRPITSAQAATLEVLMR